MSILTNSRAGSEEHKFGLQESNEKNESSRIDRLSDDQSSDEDNESMFGVKRFGKASFGLIKSAGGFVWTNIKKLPQIG